LPKASYRIVIRGAFSESAASVSAKALQALTKLSPQSNATDERRGQNGVRAGCM